ncbi:MAG TPA: hypothetical protein VE008_11605 [Burkholderiales bacterium]|nr:hypothetical protein [Burkholderiales bacterium]
MKHKVQNVTRRLVSLRGNSGQTWHIAPNTSIELPDFELSRNEKLRKLREGHLIKVEPPLDAKPDESRDSKPGEPDDDEEDRSKKAKEAKGKR